MQLSLFITFFILTIASAGGKIEGPVKAIYIDYLGFNWGNPTEAIKDAADAGFNMIILAFYLRTGPADIAQAWQDASDNLKKDAIKYAHSKGAYVIVSAGGATDDPYTITGSDYGTKAANYAKKNFLDGVDFDLESFAPGFRVAGKSADQTIDWVVNATNAARKILGNDSIITHAPQAPYFGKIGDTAGNSWCQSSGGYSAVYKKAPHIDYFLVQFYNQGASCYMNYKGIFEDSKDCPAFPGTSIKEIASYGIPLDKIVLGKPVRQSDASNGQMTASQINALVKQGKQIGWNAGVMGWLYSGKAESGAWIQAIYPNTTTAAAIKPQAAVVNTTTATVAKPAATVVAPVKAVANATVVKANTTANAASVATVAPVAKANTTNATVVKANTTTATAAKPVATVAPATTNTTKATVSPVVAAKPATAAATPKPAAATPAPAAAAPKPAAATQTCVSGNGTKTDAWCRSVNCSIVYIRTGFCKLV